MMVELLLLLLMMLELFWHPHHARGAVGADRVCRHYMWFLVHVSIASLSRRAALGTAAAASSLACTKRATAATQIARDNAPLFGTAESRTGLLDGIKSSLSGAGTDLAAEYAKSPTDISGASLAPSVANARDVAVIFHGSGGPDRETDDVLARFRAQDQAAGFQREVLVFNWMEWFTPNTNRLCFVSGSVGAAIGRQLAANKGLRSLTIVGTSAGSFAADGCCSAYVASAGGTAGDGRAAVRLTLADPFAAKDGASFSDGRGAQFFGRDADFAEHILNTDVSELRESEPHARASNFAPLAATLADGRVLENSSLSNAGHRAQYRSAAAAVLLPRRHSLGRAQVLPAARQDGRLCVRSHPQKSGLSLL